MAEETVAQLDTVKNGFLQFFTVDIPNWWNTYIAPLFTAEFWGEKWGVVTEWWNTNVAIYFTAEFWTGLWNSITETLTTTWETIASFFTTDIPAWWNENMAQYFTSEFWSEQFYALGAAVGQLVLNIVPGREHEGYRKSYSGA